MRLELIRHCSENSEDTRNIVFGRKRNRKSHEILEATAFYFTGFLSIDFFLCWRIFSISSGIVTFTSMVESIIYIGIPPSSNLFVLLTTVGESRHFKLMLFSSRYEFHVDFRVSKSISSLTIEFLSSSTEYRLPSGVPRKFWGGSVVKTY